MDTAALVGLCRTSIKKISSPRVLVTVVALLAALSAVGSSSARVSTVLAGSTYYVDSAGSDVNPCSQSKPCKTFQHAADVANGGDTIAVNCGSYATQTIRRDTHVDAFTSAVTFRSASPLCASVNGGFNLGVNNGSASGNAPSHLHFDGFDIPNGGWQVISTNCSNTAPCPPYATDLSLARSHIHGTMAQGALVNIGGSTSNITVSNNDLGPFCCNSDGIGIGKAPIQSDPVNVTIDHNFIHDLQDSCNPSRWSRSFTGCTGLGFGDGAAAPCSPGCDHIDGLQAFGGTNLVISNNVWTNAGSQNIFLQSANGGTFHGITLLQNLVNAAACSCATNSVSLSGPGLSQYHGRIVIDYNTTQKNLAIYDVQSNNQVLASDASLEIVGNIVGVGYHDMPSSSCTFRAANGSTITPLWSHNLAVGPATPLCSSSDTHGRPTFLDPSASSTNLHLASSSYGIGLGDPSNFPSTDIDGDARSAASVDVGADQAPRKDTTPPVLSNMPSDQVLEATGPGGATATWSAPRATDNVDPSPSVSCSATAGSLFPLGTSTVSCTATDASGNSSSAVFHVTVRDTTAPTLGLPANQTVEATSANGAAVSFNVTGTDVVDPAPNVSCSVPSGGTFPLGTTTDLCSVTDASGNRASGSFTVVVQDTTAPAINVPGNMTVEATSPAGATVSFAPTASDAVDPLPAVSCTPASGATFGFGSTSVSCTAADSAGNTSSAGFTVDVRDTTSPTAPPNPSTSNLTPTSEDLSWSPSADAVGVTGYDLWLDGTAAGSTAGSSYSFGGLGCGTTHTLTVAAHDAAGNESQPASASVSTLACPAAPPLPTKVGQLNAITSPAAATDTLPLSSAIQAGETVLTVVVGNGIRPASVTDNLGNVYAADAASTADAYSSVTIYRFTYRTARPSVTLTVNWSAAISQHQVAAYAVPSLVPAPLDVRSVGGTKTTSASVGGSTAQPKEVAVAAFRVTELSWAGASWPASGWTVLTDVFPPSQTGHMMVAYRLVPTPGAVSLGFSLGPTARDWSGALATYIGG